MAARRRARRSRNEPCSVSPQEAQVRRRALDGTDRARNRRLRARGPALGRRRGRRFVAQRREPCRARDASSPRTRATARPAQTCVSSPRAGRGVAAHVYRSLQRVAERAEVGLPDDLLEEHQQVYAVVAGAARSGVRPRVREGGRRRASRPRSKRCDRGRARASLAVVMWAADGCRSSSSSSPRRARWRSRHSSSRSSRPSADSPDRARGVIMPPMPAPTLAELDRAELAAPVQLAR